MSVTADLADFDDGFDDGEEGGLSGFYVLAIFLALLGAFLIIVMFAYQKGVATGALADDQLPVIAADPVPAREEVPLVSDASPRREVYDRLEGNAGTVVVADTGSTRDPLDGYASAPTAAQLPAPTSATPTTQAPVRTQEPVATAPKPEVRTAAATPAPAPVKAEPKSAATTEPAASKPQPAPAAVSTTVASATSGSHVVQVGAFGSNDEALRYYDTLSGKLGQLVAAKSPDVQSADVNGKTYHRLRLGPFETKDAANGYCSDLKTKGQDCLVRSL